MDDDLPRTLERDERDAIITEEVFRLPAKYRDVVLLCWMEGATHEEASRRLGWPLGTVKSRLAWARRRLDERLTHRGLSPSIRARRRGRFAETDLAEMPPALVAMTTRSASSLLLADQAAHAISAPALALVQGMIRSMMLRKLCLGFAGLSLGLGFASAAIRAGGDESRGRGKAIAVSQAAASRPPGKDSSPPTGAAERAAIVRRALAEAEGIPDPADRAEALLRLAGAQLDRRELAAARSTLASARQAALAIKPDANPTIPHPIIRVAATPGRGGPAPRGPADLRDGPARDPGRETRTARSQDWANLRPHPAGCHRPRGHEGHLPGLSATTSKRRAKVGASRSRRA